MPKIVKLQNQEREMLTAIKNVLITSEENLSEENIETQISQLDASIKSGQLKEGETLEKLNQKKNNLLKLQELNQAMVPIDPSQSINKANDFFSILDHGKGHITSVSYAFPGLPALVKNREDLLLGEDALKPPQAPQILRIPNPSKCDITVEFNDGGSFTKHANGDISLKMSEKNPTKKKAQGLYAFTHEILLEYKKQEKAANGSKKIPIAINFEGIPDNYKDEWKKETLKNIIYNYTLDGDSHGRQDRFNQVIAALIAGGSMTIDDVNRYSIKMSEAAADKTRFTFYSALSTQQTVDDLKFDFVTKEQMLDSEWSGTFKKGGAKAVNTTLGLLKGAVNLGLRAIGGHDQISQSTGMINRKDNKTLILEDLHRLYKELNRDFPNSPDDFKEKVKSNSAYTRLIDKYMTSEQIYDLLDSKNKFDQLKLQANPTKQGNFTSLVAKGFDEQQLQDALKLELPSHRPK